jgi:hypothetical protein
MNTICMFILENNLKYFVQLLSFLVFDIKIQGQRHNGLLTSGGIILDISSNDCLFRLYVTVIVPVNLRTDTCSLHDYYICCNVMCFNKIVRNAALIKDVLKTQAY